ncbi:MAG: NAD-dependent epimerase/dehydratase family protein [Phycisphaerales bacterium]|nr:NAD-dependent epimerase/dehydratase family protein [Planctomycetota bacterium]MCH8509680.1 NAD-dependent epimerase/dehydratase family protein [Phycisphaerales bacterium]
MKRRDFMVRASGMAVGAALTPSVLAGMTNAANPREHRKMKILILGGTGQLGPFIVERAVANGHEMTLFNRGRSGPDLFPDLEHIEGDRYTDLSGLEKAVADGRTWDAVIDTFTYVPKTVTDAMDVLLPAMGQFIVISTVSVYASSNEPNADEDAPLMTVTDEIAAGIETHREVGMHFGAMKARVERAAEQRMPGRVTNIRPGLIVGPRDTTGRYSYWPVRASEGGRMIAPGSGDDFIQIVDVRDLGDFVVHCAERRHFGVFNAVNPAGSRTMRDVIESTRRVADADPEPVWIPAEFLSAHGVRGWQDMPAWISNTAPGYAGFGRRSTDRAVRAGLKTRDLDDTNRATLAYYRDRSEQLRAERGDEFVQGWRRQIRGGLATEKETEVLAAWDAREG